MGVAGEACGFCRRCVRDGTLGGTRGGAVQRGPTGGLAGCLAGGPAPRMDPARSSLRHCAAPFRRSGGHFGGRFGPVSGPPRSGHAALHAAPAGTASHTYLEGRNSAAILRRPGLQAPKLGKQTGASVSEGPPPHPSTLNPPQPRPAWTAAWGKSYGLPSSFGTPSCGVQFFAIWRRR